ncbi:hypothetical protein ACFSO7_12140 [Bacillus sp. CGMCC 1.16607]
MFFEDYYPKQGIYGGTSISPNEEEIIFSYFKKGKGAIYLTDLKGNVTRLTSPRKDDHINPIFSNN